MGAIVIIGAGPAGLTAAIELQKHGFTDIAIIEASNQVGGISKTVNYKGNRIDIGGHRFFSKSDWVMDWWAHFLPIERAHRGKNINLVYQGRSRKTISDSCQVNNEEVMLVRDRLSRIYYNKRFFNYPLKLSLATLANLGVIKTVRFGLSYVYSQFNPIVPERSLQDFLINRFGKSLFQQFFREYTEKVWGVPCSEISADWGAQRIKSLSVKTAIFHALKQAVGIRNKMADQTPLIENFLYPKYGPGQMWELVARRFIEGGGKLVMNSTVNRVVIEDGCVKQVTSIAKNGTTERFQCDQLISTMPIKELIQASSDYWTPKAKLVAQNLQYRDFITVGLLYRASDLRAELKDNWIYIQEPGVQVGRIQIFNNWSPFMVRDPTMVWLGLEFFCKESDPLWKMSDVELRALAEKEIFFISLVTARGAEDGVVLRVPKAYSGYFGEAFKDFHLVRQELDSVSNLFPVGRNGMHRYNNQDHSILTAAEAARQISSGVVDKSKIWAINIDDEYHEEASNK